MNVNRTVLAVLVTVLLVFSGVAWTHMMAGQGGRYNNQWSSGYGCGPGMMGYGWGHGMGYGQGYGMMGYGYGPEPDSPEFMGFMKETYVLRKKLHDLRFEYMESLRGPEVKEKDLARIIKEMRELREQIEKAYAKMFDALDK